MFSDSLLMCSLARLTDALFLIQRDDFCKVVQPSELMLHSFTLSRPFWGQNSCSQNPKKVHVPGVGGGGFFFRVVDAENREKEKRMQSAPGAARKSHMHCSLSAICFFLRVQSHALCHTASAATLWLWCHV